MGFYLNKADRALLKRTWTPRIGGTACRYYVASRFCAAITPTMGILYFLLVLVRLRLVSFFVLGIGISVVVGSFVLLCLTWNATSRCLGLGFGPRNFPPSNINAYERWCSERALVPFTAGAAN
jgi:hypothetical protein